MVPNLNVNRYNYQPGSQFAASKNYLPTIRAAVGEAFAAELSGGWEAQITGISIYSAAEFTVTLNDGTTLTAMANSTDSYIVSFFGGISMVVFEGATTATEIEVWWVRSAKNHFDVQLSAPGASTLADVTDGRGNTYFPSANGSYELRRGLVYVKLSGGGYDVNNFPVVVTGDGNLSITAPPVYYTVRFMPVPQEAVITVTNAKGGMEYPVMGNGNIYLLPNSTAAGNYTYAVSSSGYVTKSSTLTLSQNTDITVSLDWDISSAGDGSVYASYSSGTLTLAGVGPMKNWSSAAQVPWASVATDITTATISPTITTIGDYAFAGCNAITTLTFGGNANAVSAIGANALLDTTALTSCTVYTADGAALEGDPFGAEIEISYQTA